MDRERRTEDVWEQRWSDPALQELGRWLTSEGVSDARAAFTVDLLWAFYSYNILPAFHAHVPFGIAVRRDDVDWITSICLPQSASCGRPRIPEADQLEALRESFRLEVSAPLSPDPKLILEFIDVGSLDAFAEAVRHFCEREDMTYVGVFVDNLRAQLKKIIRPSAFKLWLDTPNSLFDGEKPQNLLDEAEPEKDRRLRDLILSVKHGAVA